jgi:hypothetical protein
MNNPTLARDLRQAAGVRAVGTTDEVIGCELCGKKNLSHTVIVEFLNENGDSDGEAFLGSDCAARKVAGRADRKLAGKILREAQAADVKRAEAVRFSREMLAFFEAAGPDMNGKVDAYVAANRGLQRLSLLEQLKATAASIARHQEVVATGGRSAL